MFIVYKTEPTYRDWVKSNYNCKIEHSLTYMITVAVFWLLVDYQMYYHQTVWVKHYVYIFTYLIYEINNLEKILISNFGATMRGGGGGTQDMLYLIFKYWKLNM